MDGGNRSLGLTQLVPRWVFGLAAGLCLAAVVILILAMKNQSGLLLLALGCWSAAFFIRGNPSADASKAEADFHGLMTSAAGCAGAALVLFAAAALSVGGLRSEAIEWGTQMILSLLFMLFGVWWFRR